MARICALGVFLWASGVAAFAEGPERFIGDFAGWAYVEDGSDFPMRMHGRADGADVVVTLDLPHQRAYGLAVENIGLEGDTVRFKRRNKEGKLWTYVLNAEGNDLRGQGRLEDGSSSFEFELHRSTEPLPYVDPKAYEDAVGVYRGESGQTILINKWFWGELRCSDTATGRFATMFAKSDSEFFIGPAMYVPAPVFARLSFERDGSNQVTRLTWVQGHAPPQTLQRLESVEEKVEFKNGEVMLRGTLIKPGTSGRYAAIVVLGGSDWGRRDVVRREADQFVALGLAALIFDHRGEGQSTGKQVCTFDQTAADACAGVAFLKGRSDIDVRRIGLSGRSRGGWFAPLAASKCDDVAFLTLFVPPAISPARQETTRRLNEMRAAGLGEHDVKEGAAYLELQWRATQSDADWQSYIEARAKIDARGWLPYLWELGEKGSDDYEWDRLNMRYDPIPVFEKVLCPLLAFFGEKDTNVTPDENVGPMRSALQRGGNKDFLLKIVPGADHGLRAEPYGTGPGRTRLHRSVGQHPDVWQSVRAWLGERLKASGS